MLSLQGFTKILWESFLMYDWFIIAFFLFFSWNNGELLLYFSGNILVQFHKNLFFSIHQLRKSSFSMFFFYTKTVIYAFVWNTGRFYHIICIFYVFYVFFFFNIFISPAWPYILCFVIYLLKGLCTEKIKFDFKKSNLKLLFFIQC